MEALFALGGFAVCYVVVALRQRKAGEKWADTLVRPFNGGGPPPVR